MVSSLKAIRRRYPARAQQEQKRFFALAQEAKAWRAKGYAHVNSLKVFHGFLALECLSLANATSRLAFGYITALDGPVDALCLNTAAYPLDRELKTFSSNSLQVEPALSPVEAAQNIPAFLNQPSDSSDMTLK